MRGFFGERLQKGIDNSFPQYSGCFSAVNYKLTDWRNIFTKNQLLYINRGV